MLSGGSTLCKNFPDRLMREIKRLAVEDMKIRISAPAERKYTTWIGGSILAGLSTFRKVSSSCRVYRRHSLIIHLFRCGSVQTNGTKTPRLFSSDSHRPFCSYILRPGHDHPTPTFRHNCLHWHQQSDTSPFHTSRNYMVTFPTVVE